MSVSDKSLPTLKDGVGRPSKRTKKLETELLKAIEDGAPFVLACASVGICMDTFVNWRRSDPAFVIKVEKVAAKGALKRLRKIEQHGEESFAALSWMLERRWPELFAKPEVALNVGIQNNVNGTNGQSSLELIVIRDLEYAGLKQREGYTHHVEQPVKDVEAQVVPEEVSGYLTRDGSEGSGQIISESQAAQLNQSAEAISGTVSKMFQKYRPSLGNGDTKAAKPVVEAEAEVIEVPIEHRPGDEQKTEFWAQFVGGRDRAVESSTAVFVVTTIVGEVIGAHRVGKVEFKGPVSVGDCLDRIDQLVGVGSAAGFQRLQRRAGY